MLADVVRFDVSLPAVEDSAVSAVSLDLDPALPGVRDFRLVAGPGADLSTTWRLDLPRPAVQRFEYRLLVTAGGQTAAILDLDNAVSVETAFGQRSVVEMPSYAAPSWLTAQAGWADARR